MTTKKKRYNAPTYSPNNYLGRGTGNAGINVFDTGGGIFGKINPIMGAINTGLDIVSGIGSLLNPQEKPVTTTPVNMPTTVLQRQPELSEQPIQNTNKVFFSGGKMKYPKGGGVNNDPTKDPNYSRYQSSLKEKEPILKDKARLYYYTQQFNKPLRDKNPEVYDKLNSDYGYNPDKPLSTKTRTVGADKYAKENPDFYLSPEEQQKVLGNNWNDYTQLRGKYGSEYNLLGEGDDATKPETWKVGARHAVAFNPVNYKYEIVPDENNKELTPSTFDYNIQYDPSKEDPYVSSLKYQRKAYGGNLTEYSGPTHENGGVTLNANTEVEGGETRGLENTPTEDYIFSDRLKTIDGKTTFAKRSKNINNKYSLRPWDHISNDAKERELTKLMEEHELVRQADEANTALNEYKKGGPIHIKPENRGKFNATKARTGKTTEELTHSSNPITRKRAIFAQNAAKWHHAEGGPIKYGFGDFLSSPEGNAALQGVGLIGKQIAASNIKPQTLSPLSYLDESKYVPNIQGISFAPTNIDESLKAYDTGYKGYEKAAAESVDSPAAYLTRMNTIAGSKASGKAGIIQDQANKDVLRKLEVDRINKDIEAGNIGRKLQVAGVNKDIARTNTDIQQRNLDSQREKDNLGLQMISDWGTLLSGYSGDKQRQNNLDAYMAASGTDNYEIVKDPKSKQWKRVYRGNNNPTTVRNDKKVDALNLPTVDIPTKKTNKYSLYS